MLRERCFLFYSAATSAVCTVGRWARWADQKEEEPLTEGTLGFASQIMSDQENGHL